MLCHNRIKFTYSPHRAMVEKMMVSNLRLSLYNGLLRITCSSIISKRSVPT